MIYEANLTYAEFDFEMQSMTSGIALANLSLKAHDPW